MVIWPQFKVCLITRFQVYNTFLPITIVIGPNAPMSPNYILSIVLCFSFRINGCFITHPLVGNNVTLIQPLMPPTSHKHFCRRANFFVSCAVWILFLTRHSLSHHFKILICHLYQRLYRYK